MTTILAIDFDKWASRTYVDYAFLLDIIAPCLKNIFEFRVDSTSLAKSLESSPRLSEQIEEIKTDMQFGNVCAAAGNSTLSQCNDSGLTEELNPADVLESNATVRGIEAKPIRSPQGMVGNGNTNRNSALRRRLAGNLETSACTVAGMLVDATFTTTSQGDQEGHISLAMQLCYARIATGLLRREN